VLVCFIYILEERYFSEILNVYSLESQKLIVYPHSRKRILFHLKRGTRDPPLGTFLCLHGMLSLDSVTSYSKKTALLILEHNHPLGSPFKALVDVNLLLNTLKSHETQIGEWVNVIGYIERIKKQSPLSSEEREVRVQALVMWSSGPFHLEGYEKSLDRKVTEAAPGESR
jgi:hypothetical protein